MNARNTFVNSVARLFAIAIIIASILSIAVLPTAFSRHASPRHRNSSPAAPGAGLFKNGPSNPTRVDAAGATIIVNSSADTVANDGVCTLREAINAANTNTASGAMAGECSAGQASPAVDSISFNIPGPGVHTISPSAGLPVISEPVVIDGFTQPGSAMNSNALDQGINAVLQIELDGTNAGNNAIGLQLTAGGSTVRGLVINRFKIYGIWINTVGGNHIEGNFIGTTTTGTTAAGNVEGIHVDAPNNVFGGVSPQQRNLISGSVGNGELILRSAGNIVQGNYIGLSGDGNTALGTSNRIGIDGPSNLIGGATVGAGNVIAGSGGNAITTTTADNTVIQGNRIGVNASATAKFNSNAAGIALLASNKITIGGTSAGAGNIIGGFNHGIGLNIATNNLIQGNFIGTDATGTRDLGNSQTGIIVAGSEQFGGSTNNLIGGTAAGAANLIAFNHTSGVRVDLSSTKNSISGNSIYSNGVLGIDLDDNSNTPVTANDACDGDVGGNNLQNFPVLTSSLTSGGSTTIAGTLNSTANTTFTIEFFANSSCSPSGSGEGRTFLGSTQVTTDGSCNAIISAILPVQLAAGQVVTATATDPAGNTSEFSSCTAASSAPPGVQFSASTYNIIEDCTQVQLTVIRTGDTSGASTVDFMTSDGGALQRTDYTIGAGTVAFAPGETSKSFFLLITEDHYVEGAEQFSVALSNPTAATIGNPNVATVTISDDDTAQTPSPSSKTFGETLGGGQETPSNGSTAWGITLVQLSADETTAQVSLSFNGLSSAQTSAHIHGPAPRGLSAPVLFTLPTGNFNAFQLNLTQQQAVDLKAGQWYLDVHSSNFATGEIRAQLEGNPIDDPTLFVGQAYHDFLARQADPGGLDYWIGQIAQCGSNAICIRDKRVDVSNAFFYELEFQQTGSYTYRLYRAAFGNNQPFPNPNPDPANPNEEKKVPAYLPFMRDRARVVGGSQLAQLQLELANVFVRRSEFLNKYSPNLSTAAQFVDAVLGTILNDIGVDLASQRQSLVSLFNQAGGGDAGRAVVMYRLADDNAQANPINNRPFIDAEYNRSFVYTEYAGYLRRDPDIAGFLFWLGQVNAGPLRDGTRQHGMVCSFITSAEYQQRFSNVVTHGNIDCLR